MRDVEKGLVGEGTAWLKQLFGICFFVIYFSILEINLVFGYFFTFVYGEKISL